MAIGPPSVGDNQPAYYDGSAEFEEANKENALLIAEVIMAERERCAAIAKDNCDSDIAELILGKAGVA